MPCVDEKPLVDPSSESYKCCWHAVRAAVLGKCYPSPGMAHCAPSLPPSAPVWVYSTPAFPLHSDGWAGAKRAAGVQLGAIPPSRLFSLHLVGSSTCMSAPQRCPATPRCVPACVTPWGSPTHHCAAEGGALPLGLEQVNRETSCKAPIVSQLARSQSPPSARDVLFVCSAPKYTLGSRQIKSQLACLRHGEWCGMRSLAGCCPCCSMGVDLFLTPHTPAKASLVPWQVPITRTPVQLDCTQNPGS